MRALGLADAGGERQLHHLKAWLRDQELLLVLDNFEHLLPAAPLLVELLEAAPALKILVTSRTLLQLYGEHEFVAPPLALPDRKQLAASADLSHYAAVELFVARARAAKLDFTLNDENRVAVAELCIRLDGLPLAIELAAAHSKQLAPAAILARLQQASHSHGAGLDLLAGGRYLPASPANPARDDCLELQPAHPHRAAGLSLPGRLCRRLHAGSIAGRAGARRLRHRRQPCAHER